MEKAKQQSVFQDEWRGKRAFFPGLRPAAERGGRSFSSIKTAATLAILAGLFIFCGQSWGGSPGGQGRAPVVTVVAVTEAEVNPPSEYMGRVEAIQAVDLRARVEGFLEEVKFEEGADVASGDLLYVIEKAPYEADVGEVKAQVAEAEATLTKARQYLDRLKSVEHGGVSASDLETAVSTELQAKARLEEARAAMARAQLDLGYTSIHSPITGRIGRTAYTRGNLVGPSSGALARIVQLDPIRVVYSVSDNDLIDMRMDGKGQNGDSKDCVLTPRIQLSNQALYPLEGRVEFIDNQVDAGTGTVAIRAEFDNPDGVLLPGQYVTVLVSCKEGRKLPVIPQSAVLEDREGRFVFVVDSESKVQQRRIETGPTLGTRWAVEKGLSAGELVIVQGVQKVKPGSVVDVVTEQDAAPGSERG